MHGVRSGEDEEEDQEEEEDQAREEEIFSSSFTARGCGKIFLLMTRRRRDQFGIRL